MSSEAVGWTFKFSPYKGAALAVHLALADSVNDAHEDRFWMRQASLAEKARVSRGAVVRAIAQMVDDGLVELLDDRHATGEANEYRFLMPAETPQVFGWTLRATRTRGARSGDKGCAPSAQDLVRVARKEKTQVLTQEEPNTDARAASLELVIDEERSDEFDEFWTLYPRRDGKPAARKAWVRATKRAPVETIMGGLSTWITYWRARNQPEYVPWAQKWLNQEQWNAAPPKITGRALGPGSNRIGEAWAGVPSGRIKV